MQFLYRFKHHICMYMYSLAYMYVIFCTFFITQSYNKRKNSFYVNVQTVNVIYTFPLYFKSGYSNQMALHCCQYMSLLEGFRAFVTSLHLYKSHIYTRDCMLQLTCLRHCALSHFFMKVEHNNARQNNFKICKSHTSSVHNIQNIMLVIIKTSCSFIKSHALQIQY